jgi:hypothetical protein
MPRLNQMPQIVKTVTTVPAEIAAKVEAAKVEIENAERVAAEAAVLAPKAPPVALPAADQDNANTVSPGVVQLFMRKLSNKEYELVKHRIDRFEKNPVVAVSHSIKVVDGSRVLARMEIGWRDLVAEARNMWDKVTKAAQKV